MLLLLLRVNAAKVALDQAMFGGGGPMGVGLPDWLMKSRFTNGSATSNGTSPDLVPKSKSSSLFDQQLLAMQRNLMPDQTSSILLRQFQQQQDLRRGASPPPPPPLQLPPHLRLGGLPPEPPPGLDLSKLLGRHAVKDGVEDEADGSTDHEAVTKSGKCI